MVLKVDHISYSCSTKKEAEESLPEGYEEEFIETDIPNIQCKKELLHYDNPVHTLRMMKRQKGGVPIEITEYRQVGQEETGMNLEGDILWIDTPDIGSTAAFFRTLGFAGQEELVISPILDRESFRICLRSVPYRREACLDSMGYTSLALFVDDLHREVRRLEEEKIRTTGISPLTVQDRDLEISFVIGSCNEIVELISLRK